MQKCTFSMQKSHFLYICARIFESIQLMKCALSMSPCMNFHINVNVAKSKRRYMHNNHWLAYAWCLSSSTGNRSVTPKRDKNRANQERARTN